MDAFEIIDHIATSIGQPKEIYLRNWAAVENHFHFRMTDEEKSALGTEEELKKAAGILAHSAHAQFLAAIL